MTADDGHRVDDGPDLCAAYRPYIDAVVAALETAGVGVESHDLERPLVGGVREIAVSILIDRSSAGRFAVHQALTLSWDEQLGWGLGIFYANGKSGYHWLLPVPMVATPDEVVAAVLAARSGAELPEVPDEPPPAHDSAAWLEEALAAYRTDPPPPAHQAQHQIRRTRTTTT